MTDSFVFRRPLDGFIISTNGYALGDCLTKWTLAAGHEFKSGQLVSLGDGGAVPMTSDDFDNSNLAVGVVLYDTNTLSGAVDAWLVTDRATVNTLKLIYPTVAVPDTDPVQYIDVASFLAEAVRSSLILRLPTETAAQ